MSGCRKPIRHQSSPIQLSGCHPAGSLHSSIQRLARGPCATPWGHPRAPAHIRPQAHATSCLLGSRLPGTPCPVTFCPLPLGSSPSGHMLKPQRWLSVGFFNDLSLARRCRTCSSPQPRNHGTRTKGEPRRELAAGPSALCGGNVSPSAVDTRTHAVGRPRPTPKLPDQHPQQHCTSPGFQDFKDSRGCFRLLW